MAYFAGIDNGLNGAIVIVNEEGTVIERIVMPVFKSDRGKNEYDVPSLAREISHYVLQMVVLEKAQAFPGQGVTSMFSIGKGYGIWMGILAALKIPFTIVHPKTWQGEVLRDLNRADTKQASALYAQRVAPNVDWRATERSKNIHDGLTDAFCMAIYAKNLCQPKH